MRCSNCLLREGLLRLKVLLFSLPSVGWGDALPAEPPRGPEENQRATRLQEMKEAARKIRMFTVSDKGRFPVPLVAEPVLRMTDMSRDRIDGTIWLWGRGRPCAAVQLWTQIHGRTWNYAFSSLSTGLVAAEGDGGLWSPRRPGVVFTPFPDAPAPDTRPVLRIRQMKDLARRFTAHQFWDPNNQRTELRLLPQPIHRYDEVKAGLVSGGVFAFCHDTDPEVLLLVEAVEQGVSRQWQYACAPLASAELHVTLDRREIWEIARAPGISGHPSAPYWLTASPRKPNAGTGDFSPVGTWDIANNRFVFRSDGTFTRKVTSENPAGYWWEGDWKLTAGKIEVKYTRGKTNVGDTAVLEVIDDHTMDITGWGKITRVAK